MDLEVLRNACLALPGVQETIKWEHNLVFTIGEKMFCITDTVGNSPFSCKVADERFEELLQVPGIQAAPYLARARWVLVTPACGWKPSQKLDLVRDSYRLVRARLPKKVKTGLGLL